MVAAQQAGERMAKMTRHFKDMTQARERAIELPIEGERLKAHEEADTAAERLITENDWQTGNELTPELQRQFLKALDFNDALIPQSNQFYVCAAGPDDDKCGLAFPSKLWLRQEKGSRFKTGTNFAVGTNWSFKCQCEWGYLQEEAE